MPTELSAGPKAASGKSATTFLGFPRALSSAAFFFSAAFFAAFSMSALLLTS